MPTDPAIFGFGNEWYAPALQAAEPVELPSRRRIRMVSAPYFLATKIAAFEGRGGGDYLMSHDMEDIVALLDGRPEVIDEIRNCPEELRRHLAQCFRELWADRRFREVLPGHLPSDKGSQARLPIITRRIQAIGVSFRDVSGRTHNEQGGYT